MTTRSDRTGHVRLRPPSTGRPAPVRVSRPDPHRVRQHRGLDARRQSLPLPTRLLLLVSVIALGGAVFLTATGGIGPLVATLGTSFAGAFGKLTATAVPSASVIVATNSPIINAPDSAYSRTASVSLRVTIPLNVVGLATTKVRVYVALTGLDPAPIAEAPIGSTVNVVVPVQLTKGRNDFSATIVRSGVESESSPTVTITFDKDPPKITIKSPKPGSTVNNPNATIKGATEPGATLIAHNAANGTSVTAVAGSDGTFSLVLPLQSGTNAIHIDATDLAGNVGSLDVSYVQGSGKMSVSLHASLYRISISHLGSLQLTVIVADPTGTPLAGATAFFTLQIPGLSPISGQATTGADGRASFTTPLIGTPTVGKGQATVLVTQPVFGQATDRAALTFVK